MRGLVVLVLGGAFALLAGCVEDDKPPADPCREMCNTFGSKLCACGYGCGVSTESCYQGTVTCDRTADSCARQRADLKAWTCADLDAFFRWVDSLPRDQLGACGN